MEAHGYSPGPTQRPLLTGLVSGMAADLPAIPVIWYSGAAGSVAKALGLSPIPTVLWFGLIMAAAGLVYGRIFMRAANDPRGGWLFGISYGFLLWMVGPVTVMQWALGTPVATGVPAMGLMGSHLVYGLAMGALFPWIHRFLQPRLGRRLQKRDEPIHFRRSRA